MSLNGPECEFAGHMWEPMGGGLETCGNCWMDRWADELDEQLLAREAIDAYEAAIAGDDSPRVVINEFGHAEFTRRGL